MRPEGYWEGFLSSSALSTATAISALALAGKGEDVPLIAAGARWLAATQAEDGGWGDTPESPSNLSTTLLTVSALTLAGRPDEAVGALARAEAYVVERAGRTPEERVQAVRAIYGEDRTFAVPILMNCALADLVPWSSVPDLPFELAVVPQRWYRALQLHVVSYALPALIAVGLVIDACHPPRNPLRRALRRMATNGALARLAAIQPSHGGFLDATPLTAFVGMSLIRRFGADRSCCSRW
ncbi:MAG: hypothetical protein K8E24_012285, partial [Methanobacterium paludis]|nr:hypothetical protein [Methanobacterium paludis]